MAQSVKAVKDAAREKERKEDRFVDLLKDYAKEKDIVRTNSSLKTPPK